MIRPRSFSQLPPKRPGFMATSPWRHHHFYRWYTIPRKSWVVNMALFYPGYICCYVFCNVLARNHLQLSKIGEATKWSIQMTMLMENWSSRSTMYLYFYPTCTPCVYRIIKGRQPHVPWLKDSEQGRNPIPKHTDGFNSMRWIDDIHPKKKLIIFSIVW